MVLNEWRFIPKRAPWFGGWWERLIGITKSTIKKVLGRALVSYETLHTIVTEIEGVMNDRPLTYVTSDASDQEPLTPAHLLYGRRITSLPLQEDVPVPHVTTQTDVTKRARAQGHLISQFRERWRHEYLILAHLSLKTSCSIGKTPCGISLSHPRDLLIPST